MHARSSLTAQHSADLTCLLVCLLACLLARWRCLQPLWVDSSTPFRSLHSGQGKAMRGVDTRGGFASQTPPSTKQSRDQHAIAHSQHLRMRASCLPACLFCTRTRLLVSALQYCATALRYSYTAALLNSPGARSCLLAFVRL